MRKKLVYLLSVGMMVFATFGANASEPDVSLSFSFSRNQTHVSCETYQGVNYTKVIYDGLDNNAEAGAPELPTKIVRVVVPYDANSLWVKVTATRTESIPLQGVVFPKQVEIKTGDYEYQPSFTKPDMNMYREQSNRRITCELLSDGYIFGENRILTFAVYPFQYDVDGNQLHLLGDISLKVGKGAISSAPADKISEATKEVISHTFGVTLRGQSIIASSQKERDEANEYVRTIVENPDQVEAFQPTSLTPIGGVITPPTLEAYEYTVITTRELKDAFAELIDWKRQKGYTAGVVCVEDIYTHPVSMGGDLISGINDNPGRVRAYLRAVKALGTKYVLFGGDESVMDIRYVYSYSDPDFNKGPLIPTDSYFADLTSDWDRNKNGILGERADSIDFGPEIFVGRLLCRNSYDIANYTKKLIKYEVAPGNFDLQYLNNFLLAIGTDKTYNTYVKSFNDNIKDSLPKIYGDNSLFNATILVANGHSSGSEIIETLNDESHRFGICDFFGHANPGGFSYNYKSPFYGEYSFGVTALENYKSFHFDIDIFQGGNGLNNLTNKDYPMIAYSRGCATMPYDTNSTIFNDDNIPYNFGRSFTCGKDYGGPAFIGNTRMGYTDAAPALEVAFFKTILNNTPHFGEAIALCKTKTTRGGTYDHNLKALNLLGCPEFKLWISPSIYINPPTVTYSDDDIQLYFPDWYDSTIPVIKRGFDGTLCRGQSTVTPNCVVTIFHPNRLPCFLPVKLQNGSTNYSGYFQVNEIYIGRLIDSNRTSGDYTFSGNKMTIYAYGDVYIENGFVLDDGAELNIISEGTIHINRGSVKNGTLNLISDNFDYVNGLKVYYPQGNVYFHSRTENTGSTEE